MDSDNLTLLRDSSWLACVALLSFAVLFERKPRNRAPHAHVGSILWLSAIAIRFGPQLFDSVDKDIPVVSKFISAQSQPLAVFSAAQSNKSIFSLVLRGLPFLVAISILLQLRTAIFASKFRLTVHFVTAAASTALLLWASQSYGQLKLSDKAKDAKSSAAFWRDTLTLFSHVLEAVSIIPQADTGGWTSQNSVGSQPPSPVASFSFDIHVLLRVFYRAFDLAIFVSDSKSAALLKSSNLIPLLKPQTIRHLVAFFLVSIGSITEVLRVLNARVITTRVFQYIFPLYFSIVAYDYISTSPYGEALGLKPSTLHDTFIRPYFLPKLILGLPISVALNNVFIAAAINFSFLLRVQGMVVLLVILLWVMCYAKAAPLQGNLQLLYDMASPRLTQLSNIISAEFLRLWQQLLQRYA